LFSQAGAEQIQIAGQIPPMAALVPIGGNTNLNWNNLFTAAPAVDGNNSTPVAKFFLNTNMPKWNVYLTFANGGRLLNAEGKGTTPTVPNGTYPAFDAVGVVFDHFLKAEDDAGDVLGDATAGTDITVDGVPMVAATLASLQSFTSMLGAAGGDFCASGDCALANNWIYGTDINAVGVDVKVAWNSATRARPKLAGTYSEIIYITLATSY
jgi:hypothetical protein